MTTGSLYNLGNDRNNLYMDALQLNYGYMVLPSDVYFNSPFTIAAWVYPQNLQSWARLVDIGNGQANDNIVFGFAGTSNQPALHIYNGGTYAIACQSTYTLSMSQWYFLAVSYDGYTCRWYINGNLYGTTNNNYGYYWVPNNIQRSSSYCGKSNWGVDGYSTSYVDQLQFYNQALSQGQIQTIMSYTN